MRCTKAYHRNEFLAGSLSNTRYGKINEQNIFDFCEKTRRHFLTTIAATAGGIAFTQTAIAATLMYSRSHALLSALVGVPVALGSPAGYSGALWIYIIFIGVGIDIDHFLLARLNCGNWHNLQRCLRDPSLVLRGQEAIFDPGDLWRDQRLLSHSLIGGALVAGLWLIEPYWAFATGVTLYTHLVADLYADTQTREAYLAGEI